MPANTIIVKPTTIGYFTDELYANDCEERPENCELLTKYIRENGILIRRGDVVSLLPQSKRYRNDFTYIWNGEKVIELDYTIDDYGSVPPEFVVTDTEFSPDYWIHAIAHNGIFHPDMLILFRDFAFHQDETTGYLNVRFGDTMWRCYIDDPYATISPFNMETVYFDMNPCESEGMITYAGPKFYMKLILE